MPFSITLDDAPGRPWMVMVHGMSQDHRYFSAQQTLLHGRFNLLMIDLPGHGLASELGGPFGHLEMARHITAEMCRGGISNACYWGTHTGATIAPLVFDLCPEAISTLVLEGPAIAGRNPPVVVDSIGRARDIARNQCLSQALDLWWKKTPWFDAMRNNPLEFRAAEHLAMVNDFSGKPWLDETPGAPVEDAPGLLQKISVPTLVYTGEADHTEFQQAADELAGLMDGAHRCQIAETGGFPAWERPEPVTRLVSAFLDEALSGKAQ